MARALVGYNGFVGSNLAQQFPFDEFFNSKNIEEIQNKDYELVVCCGAPAEKWRANRQPEADRECLQRLIGCLAKVGAAHMVLISTVDVFHTPVAVDEDTEIDHAQASHYGRHRYELETFIRDGFSSLTVRLPGLFGPGLKKNVIYDFLHNNALDRVHSESVYQFYDVRNLWRDLSIALKAGLEVVHLTTEPVSVAEVAANAFGRTFNNVIPGAPARYDFRTRYAKLYGGEGSYLQDKKTVLADLGEWVSGMSWKKCA